MNHSDRDPNSRLPVYLRIAQVLQERIRNGTYQPGEFLPPERDLAAELNASRQTIRLAIDTLRRDGAVAPEQGRGTRILRAGEGAAPVEAADQFHLAALIIYGMSREGSAAIIQGCQSAMRRADHHLIVCETSRDSEQRASDEARHLRALLDKGIRGIIIYAEPTDRNRLLLLEAQQRGVQVVQIDRYLPGLECDYVGVDNIVAAREMTEHLWQAGHRRIAFLSICPEPSSCRERLQGYRDTMQARTGSEADADLITHIASRQPLEREIDRALEKWLALPEPPTALFANNDSVAMQVMRTLQERGLRVPGDMAVVGFDNQYFAEFVSPPLTTVEQPFAALGEAAAQRLLARMVENDRSAPQRVLLATRLVVRQSCGVAQRAIVECKVSLTAQTPIF